MAYSKTLQTADVRYIFVLKLLSPTLVVFNPCRPLHFGKSINQDYVKKIEQNSKFQHVLQVKTTETVYLSQIKQKEAKEVR